MTLAFGPLVQGSAQALALSAAPGGTARRTAGNALNVQSEAGGGEFDGLTVGSPLAIASTIDTSTANALAVPAARAAYLAATGATLDGSGLKIGILSDSFNLNGGASSAIAAGLLPSADNIHILEEGPTGNDEGQAMAELVHSIAPGAQIYFYTAFNGISDFAAGIAALVSAGCSVIVDDVTYFNEAYYQDTGPVTKAAELAVAAGVDYFTSANNFGKNYYEAAFSPITFNVPGIGTVLAHNIGNGTPYEAVRLAGNATISFGLQWTQPFGASTYNLAVAIESYNSSTNSYSLVASAALASLSGYPVLNASGTLANAAGTYYLVFYESASNLVAGNPVTPGTFKLINFNSGGMALTGPGVGVGSGASFGHELATGVNTVAAVSVANTPLNGVATPIVESFSAAGPGITYFDASGALLATPVSHGGPQFAAPDGSPTSIFNPFYGTSAAAPSAAAVGLLMIQADSRLATQQVTYLLQRSAIATASTITGGAGLIQANTAVAAATNAATTPIWTAQGGSVQWNAAANWSDNAVPGPLSTVTICDGLGLFTSGYTVEESIAQVSVGSLLVNGGTMTGALPTLQIDAGATLCAAAMTFGAGSLNVLGALDIGGGAAASGIAVGGGGVLTVVSGGGIAGVSVQSGGTLVLRSGAAATATYLGAGGYFDLNGVGYAPGGTATLDPATDILTIQIGGTTVAEQLSGTYAGLSFALASDNPAQFALGQPTGTVVSVQCFCEGTRIATPDGDVAIESLRPGDPVITARGTMPVLWRGVQTVARRFADPVRATPIRIAAGALAEGVPARDLLVSPGHALLLDGVMVQAAALLNGSSIARATALPERWRYHHIELASHEILFAEGTAAESWLQAVEPIGFDNLAHRAAAGRVEDVRELDYPRARSARQVPDAIRRRVAQRAARLNAGQWLTA